MIFHLKQYIIDRHVVTNLAVFFYYAWQACMNWENDSFRLREGYAKSILRNLNSVHLNIWNFSGYTGQALYSITVGLGYPLKTEDPYPN